MKRSLFLGLPAILTAILVTEGICRLIFAPGEAFQAAWEVPLTNRHLAGLTKTHTIDADFGFRPILGTRLYGEYGTLRNEYALEKRADVTRLLFIGDSVTRRGKIVDALRRVYGDTGIEYWNAGVDAYNTVQEIRFYTYYNEHIQPDHVILTFHNNDFVSTPVAFRDYDGRLVVHIPYMPRANINTWLFRYSFLYRWYLGTEIKRNGRKYEDQIRRETRRSLLELSTMLQEDGIRLTVLLHPILKRYETWTPREKQSHADATTILRELGIRYFDLLEPLRAALQNGVRVQEGEDDPWHPSTEVARYFADHLHRSSLLTSGRD